MVSVTTKQDRRIHLDDAVLKANRQEAEDLDYQVELSEWDRTLQDGLTALDPEASPGCSYTAKF